MIRIVTLALVVSVFVAECSYDEIVQFVEESAGGSTSLGSSPDPGIKAAGASPTAIDSEEQVKEATEKALDPESKGDDGQVLTDEQRRDLVGEAARARPANNRLQITHGWLARATERDTVAFIETQRRVERIRAAPDPNNAADRKFIEDLMDATHEVLPLFPPESDMRPRLLKVYCGALDFYRRIYGQTLTGTAYLEFTDPGLCPGGVG